VAISISDESSQSQSGLYESGSEYFDEDSHSGGSGKSRQNIENSKKQMEGKEEKKSGNQLEKDLEKKKNRKKIREENRKTSGGKIRKQPKKSIEQIFRKLLEKSTERETGTGK